MRVPLSPPTPIECHCVKYLFNPSDDPAEPNSFATDGPMGATDGQQKNSHNFSSPPLFDRSVYYLSADLPLEAVCCCSENENIVVFDYTAQCLGNKSWIVSASDEDDCPPATPAVSAIFFFSIKGNDIWLFNSRLYDKDWRWIR